jgi:hypothetical protein
MTPIYSSRRAKIILIIVVIMVVAALALLGASSHKTTQTKLTTAPSVPTSNPAGIPTGALKTIASYLQAREDSNGADQSSPTSWLTTVQPITTASWFAQLQPSQSSTSSVSSNYTIAQSGGYIVQADVTGCVWDNEIAQTTPTSGVVSCSLTDTTEYKSNHQPVTVSTLPYAWVYSGQQQPAVLWLVNQSGVWLVNNDTTGDGS